MFKRFIKLYVETSKILIIFMNFLKNNFDFFVQIFLIKFYFDLFYV